MTGRLGYPNAGRLTTGAMQKTNGVALAAIDGFFRIPYKAATAADGFVASESSAVGWFLGEVLTEGAVISEPLVTLMVTYIDSLADALVASDLLVQPIMGWTQTDTVAITPQHLTASITNMLEAVHVVGQAIGVKGWGVTAAETVTLAVSTATVRGVIVQQLLTAGDTAAANQIVGRALADSATLQDQARLGIPATLSSSVTMGFSVATQGAVLVAETLRLSPVLVGAGIYGRTVSERAELAASLANFFGLDLADTWTLSATLGSLRTTYAALSQSVTVAPAVAPQLVMRLSLDDAVDLSPSELLQAIYAGALSETVDVVAGYVAPNGGFTTWVMNTRTAALSEYTNYEFNSFGLLGNRSVGAASDGLYELVGDDDAGDAIVAQIKSGFLQFGGTKLSRLNAAYLATRGDASFVLRIETGQGELYDYAVSTRDMRSTKVHMGKGQRARYFSFELISAGGDFDIDTLEFVPIVVNRRV